jgi:hypothetical protein
MPRAGKDRRPMNGAEKNGSEPETEVVAKPTRRRLTVEYKRTIVREADDRAK